MWKGYTRALIEYGKAICKEWISRGYKDTTYNKLDQLINTHDSIIMPPWIGDEKFHLSHRNILIYKNYEWYSQLGWEPAEYTFYLWPQLIGDLYILKQGTIYRNQNANRN